MRTHVVFPTSMFPDESEAPANEEYLKAGKWSAQWLEESLPAHGIGVKGTCDEDWGQEIELAGDHDRVKVACSQIDDEVDQWLIFCGEEGWYNRLFFHLKGKEGQMPVVVAAIARILREGKQIREIGWFDYASRNGWDDKAPDPFAPLAAGNRPKRGQKHQPVFLLFVALPPNI